MNDTRTDETIKLLYEMVRERKGEEEADRFLTRVRSLLTEDGYD